MKTWTTHELELKLQIPRSFLLSFLTRLQEAGILPPSHGRIRVPVHLVPALDRMLGGGVAW